MVHNTLFTFHIYYGSCTYDRVIWF